MRGSLKILDGAIVCVGEEDSPGQVTCFVVWSNMLSKGDKVLVQKDVLEGLPEILPDALLSLPTVKPGNRYAFTDGKNLARLSHEEARELNGNGKGNWRRLWTP